MASTTANGIATFSWKAYTAALLSNAKAMLFAMAANPVTWIITIVGAVGLAINAYRKWNPTIEEQKEKISELNDEYENTVQELKTLGDEINKNTKRIDELLSKNREGTITLVEQDELDKLILANKLLKEQEEIKKLQKEEVAIKYFEQNKDTFNEEFGDIPTPDTTSTYYSPSTQGHLDFGAKGLIAQIQNLDIQLQDAIEKGDSYLIETIEEDKKLMQTRLQEKYSDIMESLLAYQNGIKDLMRTDGTFENPEYQSMWDTAENWKKLFQQETNRSGEWNQLELDVVLSDASLAQSQEEIREKFANGTPTEEDIKKYTALNEALKKSNLIVKDGQTPISVYIQYMQGLIDKGAEISALEEPKIFTFEEVLSGLEESYSSLKTLKEEVSSTKKISVDTIQDIMGKYPKLTNLLSDYIQEKKGEQDIINALTEEYETDLDNYKTYILQKNVEDEDFYSSIVSNLSEDLIKKADQYGIELGNYTTYLEAKLALDKQYALKKAQVESATKKYESTVDDPVHYLNPSLSAYDDKIQTENELADIEEIIKAIDTSIDIVIPDFKTDLFSKPKKDDKEDKFSEEYDWIARSVENAQRAVTELDEKLSNTNGFQKRIDVLDELKVANQNLVDVTKKASDKYEDIWLTAAAKIPDKYQDYITGDQSKYTVQTFGNEETYNNVIAAANAYDKWQESVGKYDDAVKKLNADEAMENSILLEKEELKLEIHNLDNQETMTVTERLKWLEREKELKANILKYNLLMATSEKERLRLQAEYDKYIEGTVDSDYEIKKNKRANKISFYDSRIQDFQNQIDYTESTGGQGTEEQYTSINEYLEKQKDTYRIDRDEAKAKRDTYKYGTDKYKQYNDELQEAQDNIYACTTAQLENNKAILLLPVKKLEDDNKLLEEKLALQNKSLEKTESAIGYATLLVQDEIDALNENKEAITKAYEDQIKVIEEQKKALTDSNDERQREIDLENKKFALEKAIRNKTTRVYRAGEGFVYESDAQAIRDAQQDLDQQQFDNTIADFDKQIDTLNTSKEDDIELIDAEIKTWEDYAKKLNDVSDSYDRLISKRNFLELFNGEAGEIAILNKDIGILNTIQSSLNNTKFEVDTIQAKIDANNLTIQAIKDEVDAYTGKAGELLIAQEKIRQAILKNDDEIKAIEDRTTKSKELSDTWIGTNSQLASALGYITTSHTTARDSETTILGERKKALEAFRDEAVKIYGEIATEVNKANNAFDSLKAILNNARSTYQDIIDLHIASGGKGMSSATITFPDYHSGGIVNSSNKLPENLIKLTEANLKPNETLAKLLNGEVVLNNNQMGNMFDNLRKAYPSITPLNKRENSPMEISIGDINVYNPDNSDMIVDEIVKELPLKVIQKLHSK